MSSTGTDRTRPQQSRAVNVILWVLQVLLALAFAGAGLSKLFGQAAMVDLFANIGVGQWFRFVTGALEIAGAIGLLIPRLCGLAALGLICVMVGAIISHIFVLGTSFILPLIYLVLLIVVVLGRRNRIRAIFVSRR